MTNVKHAVKHKAQTKNYNGGPISLEMLLDFHRIPYKAAALEKMCEATPTHGTSNAALVRAAESFGATIVVKENASTDDLIKALRRGRPVLVNYFNPITRVGHFGIVKGIEVDSVIFADPKNGDDYMLTFRDFENAWHSHDKTHRSWMMHIA